MVDVGALGQLRPGSVLIGKYEIVRPIGRGGFGLVYEAKHLGLGTGVALKVLNAEGRQNPKTVARFRQEAWTAARVASENVVRVTDIDVLADGTPFLVMELLVGRDLERELKERGRLPVREAVDYLLQAANGLREAHRRGVIHRDLKTSNLFLVDEPGGRRVKVLDFGLSKLAASLGMTSTNAMLGTPLYSAPEQLRSAKTADARADIWSLGVIAYKLFSGRLPFQAATIADLMLQIMGGQPPDLARVAPDVPAGLCQIVARALEKTPERRFQSMDTLSEALAPYGSPGLVAAISTRRPDTRAPEPGPSSTFLDSSQDTPPEKRSRRLFWGAALAGAAVLVTLATGLRFGGHLLAPRTRDQAPAASALAARDARTTAPSPAAATVAPPAAATVASPATTPSAATAPSATEARSAPAARPAARTPARRAPAKKGAGSKDLGF